MDLLDQQMRVLDKPLSDLLPPEGPCLVTLPGPSTALAATILGEIGDIHRFPYKVLITSAGLDPSVCQGGHFQAAETSVSKRGSTYLRRAVWLATTAARPYNPDLNAFCQRKRKQGKHHNTAMGATCHRLLARIYVILKEQHPYVVR
jgi:transposase